MKEEVLHCVSEDTRKEIIYRLIRREHYYPHVGGLYGLRVEYIYQRTNAVLVKRNGCLKWREVEAKIKNAVNKASVE